MLLNFFLWGLKTEIRRELLITLPQSLNDAMLKAQLCEERNDSLRGFVRWEGSRGGTLGSSIGRLSALIQPPLPSSTIDRPPGPGQSNSSASKFLIKLLTPAEIQEKMEKGLCYSCDEKFSLNHRCKNCMITLLDDEFGEVIVLSDSELTQQPLGNTAELEVKTEVSLHALTNASNLWIFWLAASYRNHSVEVLIDMGSHNNFIQEGLVDQLGLQHVAAPRFRVYMGNGQFL